MMKRSKPDRAGGTALAAVAFAAAAAGAYVIQVYTGWLPHEEVSPALRWVLPTAVSATAGAWVIMRAALPASAGSGWMRRVLRELSILFACAFTVAAILVAVAGPLFESP